MSSMKKRNPETDSLLAPENAALVLIDYQPPQFNTARSMDSSLLAANVVALAKIAKLYKLPVVLSTVNVKTGINPDTIPELKNVLSDAPWIDRTSINAWEDEDFVRAVKATGRKKLIMGALWTEVCLAFPATDALREGFEVFPVVDCVAGTSQAAHEAGLQRVVQAGGQPVSWIGILCEMQRDWSRTETAPAMVKIAAEQGGAWGTELWLKEFESKSKQAAAK